MNFDINIKYIVNKSNGTVIAKFEESYIDILYYIERHASKQGLDLALSYDSIIDISKLVGKARCANEDTFNESLGKVIARKRLMRQFYRICRHRIGDTMEKNIQQIEELHNWYHKFTDKEMHTETSIENLMDKIYNLE